MDKTALTITLVIVYVNITGFSSVNEPPVLMENNETAILVQSSNGFNSTEVKPVQMFAEKGENVNINCSCSSYNSTLYVIWIRQETEVVAHNIAYNVMWQGYWINETNDRYYITNYSNLVIPDITVKDDGIYACVTGNGIREKVTTVNITVYVIEMSTIEKLLSTTLGKLLFSLSLVFPFTIAVIVAISFSCKKSMAWKKINFTDIVDDEMLPMLTPENLGKLATLRNALKKRYKEICETLKPLPNSTSTYCIDELYIDGGLKVWSKNVLGEERWTDLRSHHSIIGNDSENYDRVIIQGDSGFGKTLLCCKIAHDWYSEDKSSPFGKVDILIYLHARLLAELPLCTAIKHHLLPIDTNLSTKDIKGLLSSVSSIIVLDGFNRVPVSGSYEKSELNHILMNKMFQNCTVILTALPNFLPANYAPITKRMKLVGFSDRARNDYIREKVAKSDPKAQEIINSFFKKNPEISKFCHVPLFFVLLSHYSYQKKIPIKNDARKVTEIFHQIVLALNRYEEETEDNVNDGEQLNTVVGYDKELESVALKRILKSQKGFRFKKEKLKPKVGKTLYDKYTTLGLLIEEQVVNYTIEQKGGTKKVNSMVSKLCSKPVTIDDDSSTLSTIRGQLLETASKYHIHIEVLWLDTLTVSFSSERGYLEFGSGVQLSVLQTLQQLSISHSTKFTEDEFAGLLEYASLCQSMTGFRLRKCLLPAEVPYCEAMAALETRNISVEWILPVGSKSRYCLNLQTGQWEHKRQKMTDDEYARAKQVLGFDEVTDINVV
ncbi:hypothetical protein BSL78_27864 [Apostichopus japonicus]|uniref:Ig-like domain-containing protein n=1 Tax=Stichopus japonicus TaxID=307972 RepID=A0A2G8JHW3_STIJA|nr:hypothetical protein BSL78_27864 [Apostichopus japonicus]